ncbi:hypothetical protein [Natrialba sp. SSL1]|uniref:hypothetical protein n=1 Tax=Natrialba sp. SSL1 TaxID=1869245 RepID=UPI001113917C|nr:hypothetical protein [Natrialba sp. SSL1]
MAHAHGTILDALNRLNIIAAAALGAFFFLGLVMVGLAGDVVSWLESNRYLPLMFSYLMMAIAFLSSGSRDPNQYHWFEKVFVALVMGFMLLFAWPAFVAEMMVYAPVSQVLVLGLMAIATAILAR